MTDIVDRLRSNATLVVCPFDKRSPDYWTTPNDKPCKFCGSEPEGPDKCTGADLRVMKEAADEIANLRRELAEAWELAYAKTDKGQRLWKDCWQDEVDANELLRSSLALSTVAKEARDKALEEAAITAVALKPKGGGRLVDERRDHANEIAAAIRSMKGDGK